MTIGNSQYGGMSLSHRKVTQSLIFAGLVALIYGLWRGEAGQVFLKGARICLECIGL